MDVKASNLNLTNQTVIPSRKDGVSNNGVSALGEEKRQEACSVSFSKEGTEKSKAISFNKDSDAYREYVSRMDEILGKIANGQTVSNKDQQWFDSEVENYVSGHYEGLSEFEFERADVLSKYIEDRKANEREYKRLTEQLEADKALHDGRLFSHLKKEHDLQDEEDLVKTLTESLEEEKENFNTDKDNRERKADEAYFKEGFVDRYVEKEVQRMEDSIGRDLKKQVKLSSEEI
ncbi:hypothetical protein SAMN04487831_104174 [Pseudobutyrivibrio sp. UC1225]|uniref:hypothetical protein n=1 Tax=Pseudobutyrivibrio sp. UC1225 TaxID=1798185 RepID=UPI0008E290B4|nr:hypothetical protein [Pseudobutyrivibrio sp. UC1225]SFN87289.1 hypothetical protein SAMN04487831_104174 [Pseudobutyrivibrio sp. UC1225]